MDGGHREKDRASEGGKGKEDLERWARGKSKGTEDRKRTGKGKVKKGGHR
jgi:hypothetical protein